MERHSGLSFFPLFAPSHLFLWAIYDTPLSRAMFPKWVFKEVETQPSTGIESVFYTIVRNDPLSFWNMDFDKHGTSTFSSFYAK